MENNKFEIPNFKGIRVNLDNYDYVLIIKTNGIKQPIKFSNDTAELEKVLDNIIKQCVFEYKKTTEFKWYCEELDASYEIINVDDLYK